MIFRVHRKTPHGKLLPQKNTSLQIQNKQFNLKVGYGFILCIFLQSNFTIIIVIVKI